MSTSVFFDPSSEIVLTPKKLMIVLNTNKNKNILVMSQDIFIATLCYSHLPVRNALAGPTFPPRLARIRVSARTSLWILSDYHRTQPLLEVDGIVGRGDSGDILEPLLAQLDLMGRDHQLALAGHMQHRSILNPDLIAQMGLESERGLGDEHGGGLGHWVSPVGLWVRVYGLDQRVKRVLQFHQQGRFHHGQLHDRSRNERMVLPCRNHFPVW
jgi:hypothetical protein